MREILFKGKTEEGKWVKGVFIPDCLESQSKQQVEWGFIKTYKLDDEGKIHSKVVEVMRNTVCQYTGLKDINGKRIYEGDILQRQRVHKMFVGKVVYKDGAFIVENAKDAMWDGDLLCLLLDDTNQGMVSVTKIGNAFDNPNLLVW